MLRVTFVFFVGVAMLSPNAARAECFSLRSVKNTIKKIERCFARRCNTRQMSSYFRRADNYLSRAAKKSRCNSKTAAAYQKKLAELKKKWQAGSGSSAKGPRRGPPRTAAGGRRRRRFNPQMFRRRRRRFGGGGRRRYGGGGGNVGDQQGFANRFSAKKYIRAISLLNHANKNPGHPMRGGMLFFIKTALKVSKMKGRKIKVGVGLPAPTFKQFMANVAEIDKACTGKFKGIKNARSNASLRYAYGTWCALAAKRKEIVRKNMDKLLKKLFNGYVRVLDRFVRNVTKGDGFILSSNVHYLFNPQKSAAAIKKTVAGWSRITGVNLNSAGLVKRWYALAAKAKELVGKAVPKWSFPSKKFRYRHRRSQKIAKKTFRKFFGRISVKKIKIQEKRWVIVKNSLGIPLRRYRVGAIVFKIRKEPWCRLMKFSYTEPYKGRGRYQKSDKVYVKRYVRFQRCR
jgi:hypothetical protein